jgi:hypothetical protein
MIEPTIGRVVWYREGQSKQAAIVAYVHSNTMVNLMVIDSNGVPQSKTSVYLLQDGNEAPASSYCEWMPYQKGQAAKTEALEAKLKN